MPTHSTASLDVTAHVASSIVPAVLDVLGQSWSLAIIRALLLNENTFGQLLLELNIPRSTLSARLKHLGAMRCLDPTPNGYRLTPAGLALLPVVSLAQAWDANGSEGLPVNSFRHQCGVNFSPILVCACCSLPIKAKDIQLGAAGDSPGLLDLPRPARRSRAEFKSDTSLSAAEILGDRWTALIIALGFYGVQRYSDIARYLSIAPNILADRLSRLCDGNALVRQTEPDTSRVSYRFSERGLQLFPLIVALTEWGDHWLRPSAQITTPMRHLPCGQMLNPVLCCANCGVPVEYSSLALATRKQPTR